MFTVALVRAPNWKQPQCSSAGKGLNCHTPLPRSTTQQGTGTNRDTCNNPINLQGSKLNK